MTSPPNWDPLTSEAPEPDVAEQRTSAGDDDETFTPPRVDLEVPDADAVEQSAIVPHDEDEYR